MGAGPEVQPAGPLILSSCAVASVGAEAGRAHRAPGSSQGHARESQAPEALVTNQQREWGSAPWAGVSGQIGCSAGQDTGAFAPSCPVVLVFWNCGKMSII